MRNLPSDHLKPGGLLRPEPPEHPGESEPFGGVSPLDGQIKVPRVIANLEPTDRINYITPDAVSGDQNLYVKQLPPGDSSGPRWCG